MEPLEVIAPKWKAFSLTHVVYKEGDIVSFILAILSLVPLIILIAFATLILFRRDLHTIFFFVGQLGNEFCNYLLKHWWKEARPDSNGAHFGKYGMPSNHAQFIAFFSAYSTLFLIFRLRPNSNGRLVVWKILLIIAAYAVTILICYGRIYLGHHFWSQVLFAVVFGSIFGIFWFFLVDRIISPWFPKIVSWRICEFLLIRDTSFIPHILFFEYTCARSETRARSRKQSSKQF